MAQAQSEGGLTCTCTYWTAAAAVTTCTFRTAAAAASGRLAQQDQGRRQLHHWGETARDQSADARYCDVRHELQVLCTLTECRLLCTAVCGDELWLKDIAEYCLIMSMSE